MPDDRDVGQVHSHRAHELETFLGALQDVAGRLDRVGLVVDQADELTIEVCQFLEKFTWLRFLPAYLSAAEPNQPSPGNAAASSSRAFSKYSSEE